MDAVFAKLTYNFAYHQKSYIHAKPYKHWEVEFAGVCTRDLADHFNMQLNHRIFMLM